MHLLGGIIDKLVRLVFTRMKANAKEEIVKYLRGESTFPEEILSTMIGEMEKECVVLQEQADAAQITYNEGPVMLASLNTQYDDII